VVGEVTVPASTVPRVYEVVTGNAVCSSVHSVQ